MNSLKLFGLLLTLGLVACGGGGGGDGGGDNNNDQAGIGGTGGPADNKSTGAINGFGSIFVNGVEFDTSASVIMIDGQPGTEADLKLGMVVNVSGDIDAGTASTVEFDDSLQGPVSAIVTNADLTEKRLTILGETVLVEDGVTVIEGVTFDTLAVSDLLEISGFFDSLGELHATRVEKLSGVEVEKKDLVGTVDTGFKTFAFGSLTVDYSSADVSGLPGGIPVTGTLVEVKGALSGSTIVATEVTAEDDFYDADEARVRIEGLITELGVAGPGMFRILNLVVDSSSAVFSPTGLQTALTNNIRVEVEGAVVGGVIEATRVSSREAEWLVKATVQSVAGGVITMSVGNGQSVAFSVDNQTLFDDKQSSNILTLAGIGNGDYLEVSLIDNGSNYLASEVTRDSPDHEIVQGPVDSFVSGVSVTVLGVTFTVDHDTEFESINDAGLSNAQFFSALSVGDLVKVEDERPGDGVADEMEFE